MQKILIAAACLAACLAAPPAEAEGHNDRSANTNPDSASTLSLQEAIARTLLEHPELAAYSSTIRVREAEALQASVRANPELSVSVENALGSGDFRGFDEAEITIGIQQALDIWGRRDARTKAAELGRKVAVAEYESHRLRIIATAASRFISALSAQEELAFHQDAVALATALTDTLRERFEAGRETQVAVTRAEVDARAAQLGLELATLRLAGAKEGLASIWGATDLEADRLLGDFESVADIPSIDALMSLVEDHPEATQWSATIEQLQASLAVERVRARQDVTVGGGIRWLNGPDDAALVLEASIPLTVFDKNRGAIDAASASISAAESSRAATRYAIRARLLEIRQRMLMHHHEAIALRDGILPAARSVVALADEAIAQGRFSQLEALEARRTLLVHQRRRIEALREHHLARLEIEAITGQLSVTTDSPF